VTAEKGKKIVLLGGAGLVGQNLVHCLKVRGYNNLVVLDKNRTNLEILRQLHYGIMAECVDLAETGAGDEHFENADIVVMLQAQIGGADHEAFIRNNVTATKNVIDSARRRHISYIIHVSSSVVQSKADDDYTNTKKMQESLVAGSGIEHVILRPTLMFGWFDRKHLGWLSRFMKKMPVFPVPGDGLYMRQPLYAGDFCRIIASCIENRVTGKTFNISGLERVPYIDIIREIKRATNARARIVNIPFGLFRALLALWALFDKDPPFTTSQLDALAAGDTFEVIDWPGIFGVAPTPFAAAIEETFNNPVYSNVVLEF
jgi:nucleoside-diphosphate-sugar epimerase